MAEMVADCPRCPGKTKSITFDVLASHLVRMEYEWSGIWEVFCVCRRCKKTTVFVVAQAELDPPLGRDRARLEGLTGCINDVVQIRTYVSIKDHGSITPPEHLTDDVRRIFKEAASSFAVGNYNAAGTMFRLCLDLATRIPDDQHEDLPKSTRRNLGPRLEWLFKTGALPASLKPFSDCVKEDGDDGAHKGILTKEEAEDLQDFTILVLSQLYEDPGRLQAAEKRRQERRSAYEKAKRTAAK